MSTPDGTPMTATAATVPVGSALRIAPEFVAHATLDDPAVTITLDGTYSAAEGRYLVTSVRAGATQADVDVNHNVLRQLPIAAIVQAAAPQCIALTLDDESDPAATWITAAELSATAGRIIPQWLADQVVKHGSQDARMEVIEILYGTSALAGIPPVKTIQTELGVPHRTASDWIKRARAAGRLTGMTYHVGRKADG